MFQRRTGGAHMGWLGNEYYSRGEGAQHRCRGPGQKVCCISQN